MTNKEQTKEIIISSQTKDTISEWSVLRTMPTGAPATVGVAECIAEVNRLRDERRELFSAKKGLSQKAMSTLAGQIFFANEIVSALDALQGKESK